MLAGEEAVCVCVCEEEEEEEERKGGREGVSE